jgi:hypothetical protein
MEVQMPVAEQPKPDPKEPKPEPEKKPHPYGEDTLGRRTFDGRS